MAWSGICPIFMSSRLRCSTILTATPPWSWMIHWTFLPRCMSWKGRRPICAKSYSVAVNCRTILPCPSLPAKSCAASSPNAIRSCSVMAISMARIPTPIPPWRAALPPVRVMVAKSSRLLTICKKSRTKVTTPYWPRGKPQGSKSRYAKLTSLPTSRAI